MHHHQLANDPQGNLALLNRQGRKVLRRIVATAFTGIVILPICDPVVLADEVVYC